MIRWPHAPLSLGCFVIARPRRARGAFVNRSFFLRAVAGVALAAGVAAHADDVTLLNVSYDPTRELYQQYDSAFAAKATTSAAAASARPERDRFKGTPRSRHRSRDDDAS